MTDRFTLRGLLAVPLAIGMAACSSTQVETSPDPVVVTTTPTVDTVAVGVPAGANTPCQEVASKPGIVSATGGRSGANGARSSSKCARHVRCVARRHARSLTVRRFDRARPFGDRMPLHKLEHYLVMTHDIDATRDFYRDVIGLSLGFRADLGFPGYWLYIGDIAVIQSQLGLARPLVGAVAAEAVVRKDGTDVAVVGESWHGCPRRPGEGQGERDQFQARQMHRSH